MDTTKLQTTIAQILKNRLFEKETKAFIFGSSLKKERFFDIDVGLTGVIDKTTLSRLKEDFEESNLPYKVDLVNFNSVNEAFQKKVFNDKIVWLQL